MVVKTRHAGQGLYGSADGARGAAWNGLLVPAQPRMEGQQFRVPFAERSDIGPQRVDRLPSAASRDAVGPDER
ncbi:hypothetical protein [Streptomyces sp. NPDC059003]|uniref:hypothetical protein n=1 Tax=Streptomyces sp. NPDC059003 TaxID=3346691 RepID=UPI0036B3F23E